MNLADKLKIKATEFNKTIKNHSHSDNVNMFVDFIIKVVTKTAAEGKFKQYIHVMNRHPPLSNKQLDEVFSILRSPPFGFKLRKDWLTGPFLEISWK